MSRSLPPLLLAAESLSQRLALHEREMFREIEDKDRNRIVSTSPDAYANYLVERYTVEAPSLRLDDVHVDELADVQIDVSKNPNAGHIAAGEPSTRPARRS